MELHLSTGLLSKASHSIRRSTSKTHKSQPSGPSNILPPPDQVSHERHQSQTTEIKPPPQKRPDVKRLQSAPSGLQTTNSTLKDSNAPQSAVEPIMMVATSLGNGHRKESSTSLNKSAGAASTTNAEQMNNQGPGIVPLPPSSTTGSQTPHVLFQHIQDMASKRISTLDYLRKAHEGRVFWFNTVHFSLQDLSKLPSFTPAKLSRRATNYLLLGLSIPPVLDVHPLDNSAASAAANATAAYDFLKTLSALLGEFETFQQNHPSDGSTSSTLSRARIPHMFKRAAHSTTSRTRRSSSTTGPEIGLPIQQASSSHPSDKQHHHQQHSSQSSSNPTLDSAILQANTISTTSHPHSLPLSSTPTQSHSSISTSSFPSFPPPHPPQYSDLPNSTLLPSESPYTYLLTPPLPFAPDFHTVFATLCDILIESYQRILNLVNSPAVCSHGLGSQGLGLGEVFAKADARLRKVIVGGVIREFEGAGRDGVRREVGGVGRVVLAGLIGTGS